MKILSFLLEITIVLAIVFALYHFYFDKKTSKFFNDKGELIVQDIKDIAQSSSEISFDKDSENLKKDVEKKVNKLMKKYNIN